MDKVMKTIEMKQADVMAEDKIFTIRGVQVIIDRDLAGLYGIDTKRLNEQVRRNGNRFLPEFMFQLSKEEWTSLRSHFATINGRGRHPKYLPYAFTEHGVIMAAAILKSEIADKASVMIVNLYSKLEEKSLAPKQGIFFSSPLA